MSPTPTVVAALAAICRMLANRNLADKQEVLEFHLRWIDLCCHDCTEELDDLALCMAQFVLNHEPRFISGSQAQNANLQASQPEEAGR
jgi:hypothetical protein